MPFIESYKKISTPLTMKATAISFNLYNYEWISKYFSIIYINKSKRKVKRLYL